jgi:hypothetical protein
MTFQMSTSKLVTKSVIIPSEFLTRINALELPRRHAAFCQIAREGIGMRIAQLEEEKLRTEQRREALREQKRQRRTGPKVKGALTDVAMFGKKMPFVKSLNGEDGPTEERHTVDDVQKTLDDELYERAARTLLGVKNADEAKAKAKAAVAYVQSERRISAPSENEIMSRLEDSFKRLRGEAQPDTRTLSDLIDTVIDVDRIKTVEPAE